MAEFNETDFHALFKGDNNAPLNKNKKRALAGLNLFVLVPLMVLIIIAWFLMYLYYLSYVNSSVKYNNILNRETLNLKNDKLRYDKIKTDLKFLKTVNKNQVNVSNLLYILSLHRFGLTYVRSIKVNKGRVSIELMSLDDGYVKGLRSMSDYAVYLNIYSLQMHTGGFKITSLTDNSAKGNTGILGKIESGRYRHNR